MNETINKETKQTVLFHLSPHFFIMQEKKGRANHDLYSLTKHELGVNSCNSIHLVIGNFYGSGRNRKSAVNCIWLLLKPVGKRSACNMFQELGRLKRVSHTHPLTYLLTHSMEQSPS